MSDADQTAAPVAPQPATTAEPTVVVSLAHLRALLTQGETEAVTIGDKVAAAGKSMWQNICDFVRPVNAGWLRIQYRRASGSGTAVFAAAKYRLH